MSKILRIILREIVVKRAFTKSGWDARPIKWPGAAIGAPAVANDRALGWFDARSRAETERADVLAGGRPGIQSDDFCI